MSTQRMSVLGTGLVTSVGSTAPASCAALRSKISNPTQTRFIDSAGEWIMAHQVELEQPWRGLTKLAKMAAHAIKEALQDVPRIEWHCLPLVLCVAEKDRPGRMDGLDHSLMPMIEAELGVQFSAQSAVVAQGRVGAAVGMQLASKLIRDQESQRVLIAATDSLLSWPTLSHFERQGRLLTRRNSNGFMAGEAAGAFVVGAANVAKGSLLITGLGFSREAASIDSEEPLRADGLAEAIRVAVDESGMPLQAFDCRVSDVAGELYYFKEASLGLARVLRALKPDFPLVHPAECTGQTGSASGPVLLVATCYAASKGYGPGPASLLHFSEDDGRRAAVTVVASA